MAHGRARSERGARARIVAGIDIVWPDSVMPISDMWKSLRDGTILRTKGRAGTIFKEGQSMPTKLYVGNLAYSVTNRHLNEPKAPRLAGGSVEHQPDRENPSGN